jgi:hypothetical protein
MPSNCSSTWNRIRLANDADRCRQARELLRKPLQKHEAGSVMETYNSADTVNLPARNSMWGPSDAISWLAGQTEDAERKLEVGQGGGQILTPA